MTICLIYERGIDRYRGRRAAALLYLEDQRNVKTVMETGPSLPPAP